MNSKILKHDEIENALSIEARLATDEAVLSNFVLPDPNISSQGELKDAKKAQVLVGAAMDEAKAIKERAKALYRNIDQKAKEAKQKGHDEGYREGLGEATELQVRMKVEMEKLLKTIERDALDLVFEIAHKILGDAFKTDETALVGMIRQALQSSMGDKLVIHVNAADFEKIKARESQLMTALHSMQMLQIKSSETVPLGGCVIESELGTIEALLDDQIAAIKRAVEIAETQRGGIL